MQAALCESVLEEGSRHGLNVTAMAATAAALSELAFKGEQGLQAVENGAVAYAHRHRQKYQRQHHLHHRQRAGIGRAPKLEPKDQVHQGQQGRCTRR